MWRKGIPLTPLVGMKLVQPVWKTVWSFLRKLKTELPYDPVITLLGICPPKYKNTNSKGYMHPYVYSNIIYNSQIMEAAQVSIDRWMDKEDVVCVCVCVCVYIYKMKEDVEY